MVIKMRTGKISESILKRSILKQIKTKRSEVVQGAGVGVDCAFFSFSGKEGTLVTTCPIIVNRVEGLFFDILAAVNNVAAAGGEPIGIMVSAVLPRRAGQMEIESCMGQVQKACKHLNIEAAGGHTQISDWVDKIVLNLTIVGKKKVEEKLQAATYQPGQEIVLTKWIGLLGTSMLARNRKEILQQRLPSYMIDEAISFENMVSVIPEAATAVKSGVSGMHDVSRGGIFAALWELAENTGVGLEIDLKKIPVRQETIEICEILECNPYELYGAGSLLIVCDKAQNLIQELEKQNIPAVCIGIITDEKGKVVINEEERRFLDRPKTDAITGVLPELW